MGSGTVGTTAPDSVGVAPLSSQAAPTRKCPHALKAVRFYSRRLNEHRAKTGAPKAPIHRGSKCPRYLSQVLQRKARSWRLHAEKYLRTRTLRDFDVRPGYSGWQRAVYEVQKAYPDTKGWLLSCSASEGGWGRWVPNSQGSGVGGWLQFMPGTFAGFVARAIVDVRRRGFRVPRSAWSWYSPLGQALAGAWGVRNGMSHHWHGSGC